MLKPYPGWRTQVKGEYLLTILLGCFSVCGAMRALIFISYFFLFTNDATVALADPLTLSFQKQLDSTLDVSGGPSVIVKPGKFVQKIDHQAANDSSSFQQRYWFSDTNAGGNQSPVFLYICGESECSGSPLMFGPLPNQSRLFRAYLFSLEHRYYGQSQPFNDLSTEHLHYLSTAQALADIVQFKRAMQKQLGLTGPWILVGGSYAGDLAAYARVLYPDDFFAAWASSAPLHPKLDFREYDHFVAKLAGPACVGDIQKTLHVIESQIISEDGFRNLQKKFGAESLHHRDDFLQLLSDIASAAIQLGLKTEFCAKLSASAVDGYAEIAEQVKQKFAFYGDYSAEQSEGTALATNTTGMRQWFYQSCTEYGVWQSPWPVESESARSAKLGTDYFNSICRRLFNLPASGTAFVEQNYFKPLMQSSIGRFFVTNGSLDPWGILSVSSQNGNDTNPSIKTLMINGASHGEDLGMGGTPEVLAAKQMFQNLLTEWLR